MRALRTREGGCVYCELGGDVCGEIGRLGHEKEVVCIVIGGGRGVCGKIDAGWVAESKAVCICG